MSFYVQELRACGTVDDPMIYRQGERERGDELNPLSIVDRPWSDCIDTENRRLRQVQYRCERFDAEAPQICYSERGASQLVSKDFATETCGCQSFRLVAETQEA